MGKSKLTRRAFIGVAATSLAGLAVACKTPATQVPTVVPTVAPTKEPTPAPVEKTVLKMMWRTIYANEQQGMDAMFDAFEDVNPDITVDRTFIPGDDFDAKITAAYAAGEPPAMFANIAGPTHRFLASRDQLYDLQPFVDRDKYDLSDFYTAALEPLSYYRGQMVGLPHMNLITLMLYNKTLVEAAGLPLPPTDWNDPDWNWDTWMNYAAELTKFDSNGKHTQVALAGVGHRIYAMRNWGLEWFDKTCMETAFPKRFASDRDGVVEALGFWRDLFNKYRYCPKAEDTEGLLAGAEDLFATGKLGFVIGNMADFDYYRNVVDFEWGACPIPAPVGRPRWNFMYPDQCFIPKPQKNVEASWKLLSFAASAEGMKFYPIQAAGAIAPRKSLSTYFTDYFLSRTSEKHVYSEAEMQLCMQANEIQQGSWGHAVVEIGRYWSEAILPNYEKLVLLDEIDAATAADGMEVAIDQIISETTPDWVKEWDVWVNA